MKGSNRVLWLEMGAIILGISVAITLIFFIPYHPQPSAVANPASVPSSQDSVATSPSAPMNAVPVASSLKGGETVPAAAIPQASETSANATPSVPTSKEWPDGAMATKIIHIPDPREPAKGLIEINLHRGDDLEIDFDPSWVIRATAQEGFAGAEVAVDSGNGFETLQDSENFGTNAQSRTMRMRLLAGRSDTTYFFTVAKVRLEKPLPSVPSQTFGDLTISESGLRGLTDHTMISYLTFRNNSRVNTIAVAMHDEGCTALPCELRSSLLASDGTRYVIDTSGITGINGMRAKPENLISIEPGQELKASLIFRPRDVLSEYTRSFELQAEIVVNSNYRDYEYANYRPQGDVLPPYCKIINVMFEIPIKWHHRN